MLSVLLASAILTSAPKLAVIPTVDMSGEKWEELKTKQREKISEYINTEFARRGFEVIGREQVEAVLRDMKLDMTDEENHRRAVLFDAAKKLEADFIFFSAVTMTDQKQRDRTFYTDIEGRTDVKLWLLDAANQTPILSAKVFSGRSGGARVGDGKGSERQVQASANAVRDGLKDFLSRYPVKKSSPGIAPLR